MHTTTNSVTVKIPSSLSGSQTIGTRLYSGVCINPSSWAGIVRQVGIYSNSDFSITGQPPYCGNTVADFVAAPIGADITNYTWTATRPWSTSGQGTPYYSVSIPAGVTSGTVTLKLTNRCGTTNTPYVLNLSVSNCGFLIATPNPVSNILTLTDLGTEPVTATLTDKNSKQVKSVSSSTGTIEIDVSDLKDGTYILQVVFPDHVESQQIVVQH
jgi:hypothetical protein